MCTCVHRAASAAARAVLVLGLVLSVTGGLGSCAHRPAPPSITPLQRGLDESLHSLVDAVNGRDLTAVLEVYAPDSAAQQGARSRFEGALTLDSLRTAGRVVSGTLRADTAEALVCENTAWSEHGRPQADARWRLYKFLNRRGQGWTIVSDAEQDYAFARFTDLSVDLHPDTGTMSGRARIEVAFAAPAGEDNIILRLNRGLAVRRVTSRDGGVLPFTRTGDLIVVPFPGLRDSTSLTIDFDGSLFNESKEQGYSQVAIAPGGSFASWVTSWYPHVDGVGSKSRGRIVFTAPSGTTIASSGRPIETVGNMSGGGDGGRTRQTFRVDAPLNFSFAAARYFHKSEEIGGISLGVYFLEGGDAKADLYLTSCARVLAFLKDYYGLYPYDGYSIVEIPSDAAGGLGGSSEQGMNLFPAGGLPAEAFPLPLISHEIGHSWWGNLVSGKEGPTIDEALAQMTAVLCVEEIEGTRAMRRFLKRGEPQYPQSARAYFATVAGVDGKDIALARPPAGADVATALHELADVKGHFVYEMLRETIGDEAFRKGMRAAVTRYMRKEIALDDLRGIWEETSGRDLRRFFDQWFDRAGVPEFRMTYTVVPAADRFEVDGFVAQTGEPYEVNAEIVIATAGQPPHVERLAISGNVTPFKFTVDRRPDLVLFDPDYKILRWTDGYRRVKLLLEAKGLRAAGQTPRAIEELRGYVAAVPDGMAGRCELGIAYQDADSLERAEDEFRAVLARDRIYDFDEPVVAECSLHMGEIADLRHRRDEAKRWYSKVVAMTDLDAPQARKEAAALLEKPFTPKPRAVPADPALLARCVGIYASPDGPGGTITLTGGILTVTTSQGQTLPLAWEEGTRFRVIGMEGLTFDFLGAGPRFTELAVKMGDRVFHLTRKE